MCQDPSNRTVEEGPCAFGEWASGCERAQRTDETGHAVGYTEVEAALGAAPRRSAARWTPPRETVAIGAGELGKAIDEEPLAMGGSRPGHTLAQIDRNAGQPRDQIIVGGSVGIGEELGQSVVDIGVQI